MSLEQDLQEEQVNHLDISKFITIPSGTLVKDAIERMRQKNHNCAIITKDGALIGIFTDRDMLRKVVDAPDTWDQTIDTVMTPSPTTVNSNAQANIAMELMDEHHFRNVPVVDGNGTMIGNLTHYAVIKYLADRFPESIYNLPPHADRVTRNRGGA
jgi:CBS domain-containing protein